VRCRRFAPAQCFLSIGQTHLVVVQAAATLCEAQDKVPSKKISHDSRTWSGCSLRGICSVFNLVAEGIVCPITLAPSDPPSGQPIPSGTASFWV
jgi:hypothetical protein